MRSLTPLVLLTALACTPDSDDGTDMVPAVVWRGTVSETTLTTGETAPAALLAMLPPAGTSGQVISLQAALGGPFEPSASGVPCAPLSPSVLEATGNPALADLVVESRTNADVSRICIVTDDGPTALVALIFIRNGPATTPSFLGLGPGSYRFSTSLQAVYPAEAFAGRKVDLDKLVGLQPLSMIWAARVDDASGEKWYRAEQTGAFDFDFTPTP